VEYKAEDSALHSGQLAAVEGKGISEAKQSGQLAAVEGKGISEAKASGLLVVVEYDPFEITPASDRETTGRELSAEGLINDRKLTGFKRKKRRGY